MRITTIIPRRGINDDGKGKKYALRKLISCADTEFVHLMDDDVVPPAADEAQLIAAIGDNDMLILPLRMQSESASPNLVERLQIAEYAAIQQLTIDTARSGHPIMCSGANLLVRRNRWMESADDLHDEIPSGDDMFLLESFKRRGLRIGVVSNPDFAAIVRPQLSLRDLLRQRMRWAGKAPVYTDRDIILWGIIIVVANLLQLLCPLLLFLKFPIEYSLIRRYDSTIGIGTALLLEIVYPIYIVISLIGGLRNQMRW